MSPSTETSAAATPSSASGESSGFRSKKTMSYTMPFATLTCDGAIRCERIATTCGAPTTPAIARAAADSNSSEPGTIVSEEIANTSADGGAPSSCSSNVRARADSSVGRSKPPACSAPGACGANGRARRSTPSHTPITARRCACIKTPSRSNGGSRRVATISAPLRDVRRETPADPLRVRATG